MCRDHEALQFIVGVANAIGTIVVDMREWRAAVRCGAVKETHDQGELPTRG